MKIIILFTILLLSGSVFAEQEIEELFIKCPSVKYVRSRASSCEADNAMWVRAAEFCFSKFKKKVKTQSQVMAKDLSNVNLQNLSDQKNRQSQAYVGTDAAYKIASYNFELMIRLAEKTQDQMEEYLNNVYYPTYWDEPEEIIGDRRTFVDSKPCYSETSKAVRSILENTLKEKDLLFQSKEQALSLKKQANILEGAIVGEGSGVVQMNSGQQEQGLRANRSNISEDKNKKFKKKKKKKKS